MSGVAKLTQNASIKVNISNVIGAAKSLASLLYAEANAAYHHKNNITLLINKLQHNISHGQNISFNITVSNKVSQVIEAANAVKVLGQAHNHIQVHHHNKTHSNISVHINFVNVHVNQTKLAQAINLTRAEFASKVNASVSANLASIVSSA